MKNIVMDKKDKGISEYFNVIFCIAKTQLFLNENKIYVSKGNIIICRENIKYHFDTEGSLIVFRYKKAFFDDLFFTQIIDCRIIYDLLTIDSKNSEYLFFKTNKNSPTFPIINQMIEIYKTPDIYQAKMIKVLLVALLTYLDKDRFNTLILSESTMGSNHRFGRVLKYMGDNYASCTLQEVAKVCGYNPDYLSIKFKKVTGQSFSEKLLLIKLNKACELLLNTEMTSEEISNQIGFKDKSYFYKAFKKYYHTTPNKYKKMMTE